MKYDIQTIAFPNISTGAFGYPIEKASKIAIETVKEFLEEKHPQIEKVYFVSFSDLDLKVYDNLLSGKEITIENLLK